MTNKKKILITGAAGFIGFHAAQKLLERGDHVVGLDNFNDYYAVSLKHDRTALLRKRGIEVISGDLNDKALLKSLFDKHNFTHVLHLAAQAGVRYAAINPQAYIESNLAGFVSLLEILRLFPKTKFVYASSSSVYGANTKIPFAVGDRTDQPANLYAATKKANELIAYSYHHIYGIRTIGLRYFTVYGPWGRPDMAYYSFTKEILEGKTLSLFNYGKMRRDFTYIEDALSGTLAALDFDGSVEVFNIGNHRPEELFTFVELLEKELGKKVEKKLLGARPEEIETTYADIEDSHKRLGFYPKTTLAEGLSHFVRWYRDYHRV